MTPERPLQIQLRLSYKKEARHDPRIARYLLQGYRILDLLRISDGEVLVTLARSADQT